ncbi:MAG: carbohydrate kinase family protein [Anaerolineaceae bacterium]
MISELPDNPLRFVIAGRLNWDTVIPIFGEPQIDGFGGNLAYAAIGLKLWGEIAGLLARVGQDFPLDWVADMASLGFDPSGIRITDSDMDLRRFIAHEDAVTAHYQNPIQHFSDRGLPFPRNLLGYQAPRPLSSSRTTLQPFSIQISDIPPNYLEASAVHICPIDYLSHIILPSIFRQYQTGTITLTSCPGYMDPAFWQELPPLLSEITAFITPEAEIRNLFLGRQTDLWAMSEVLADLGPEFIIIQTESLGYYLLDRVNERRWVIPQYPSNAVDPTGSGDAFAGGFLVGYREHYDPMEAALMGSVAASVVVEGTGVFFGLDVMPGLIDARREAMRQLVRLI